MKPIKLLFTAIVASIMLNGCKSAQQIDAVYATHSFETTCLSCNETGVTVQTWGKGKYKESALKQCRKQALRDIIFKGITLGDQNCLRKPLVTEVNAEERHRSFFSKFFSDKGNWSRYAILDEKQESRKVSKNSEVENWSATVKVDIVALNNYLKENGL